MKLPAVLIAGGGLLIGLIVGALTAPAGRLPEMSPTANAAQSSIGVRSTTGLRLARAKSFVGDPADLRDLAELGRTLEKLNNIEVAELLDWMEVNAVNAFGSAQGQLARIFEWWLERDPKAARAWLQPRLMLSAQDGPLGMSFETSERGTAINAWAKKDPQGALNFAREHPHSGLATSLLSVALAAWPDPSPSANLAVLQNFPESPARLKATEALFRGWAAKEPSAALAAARQLSSAAEMEKATHTILSTWSKEQAAAAFEEAQRLGLSDPRLLSKLLGEVAEKDAAQAIRWMEELSPQRMAQCAPPVLEVWAKSDPIAALEWALANGVSFRAAYQSGSETNLDAFSTSSFTQGRRQDFMSAALAANSEATINWILSVPDEAQRNRLLTQVINAPGDPDRALRLFQELSPEYAAQVAWNLAAKQFGSNPERGAEWAAGLPAGPARERAWRGLGSAMAQPPESLSGTDRDAFFTGAVLNNTTLMNRPAAERLDPLLQIQDPVRRRDVFETAMQEMTRGPINNRSKEARAWVEQAAIPEEWKRAWRE